MDTQKRMFKKMKKIQKLPMWDVFNDILEHYTCPEECGGHCCKIYDIHLESNEAKRIAKTSIIAKDIIDASMYDPKYKNVVLPVKPCPFLTSDKCSINKIKPMTCQLYPFVIKSYDSVNPNLVMETCPMGCDILLDYGGWIASMSVMGHTNPQLAEDAIQVLQNTVLPFYSKNKPENFKLIDFPDIEILRPFLFYLETFSTESRLEIRENIIKKFNNHVSN